MNDEYSTTELVLELERVAYTTNRKDPTRALLLSAARRLRQYQWMDLQRILDVLRLPRETSEICQNQKV